MTSDLNRIERRFADQIEILELIRDRLIDQIDIYNDQNCFLHDAPLPDFLPGGREGCTVSAGPGSFVDSMFGGGGSRVVTEDTQVVITPLIKHDLDRPGRSTVRLSDPLRGILARKHDILQAILGDDWEPHVKTDGGTRYVLREQLAAMGADAPGRTEIGEAQMVGMSIRFHAPFDWALKITPTATEG